MKVRSTTPVSTRWRSGSASARDTCRGSSGSNVGASPSQVAQTARVQRAKRMIDNTDLTMTEIALAAGFGSLRRLNTVFAALDKRPPTAIRRATRISLAAAA
jgi:methylphosphotriester-DNA--protein-cysteine methyltransferase